MTTKLQKFAEKHNPWPDLPVVTMGIWCSNAYNENSPLCRPSDVAKVAEWSDIEAYYDTSRNRRCLTFMRLKEGRVIAFHDIANILPLIGGPKHGEMGAQSQPSIKKNYRLIYGYGNHPDLNAQQGFLIYTPLYIEAHDKLVEQRGLEKQDGYPIF